MRILLDGQFFAEGTSLQDMAELAKVPLSRFSFAWEDVKAAKRTEMVLAADRDYRAIFTRDGQFVELEKDYILLASALGMILNAEMTGKRQAMRAVIDKLRAKLADVNAATTEAQINAITW